MKKIRTILSMSVLLLGAANIWGQSAHKLTGKILSTKNQPVEGAIVTVLDTVNVTTSRDGRQKKFQYGLPVIIQYSRN